MRSAGDIAAFIESQPQILEALEVAANTKLPDCWVGAGFIRKAVWNELSGRPYDPAHADIDIVFFDDQDVRPERDWLAEDSLRRRYPGELWEVRNQAYMHLKKKEPPYRDTADGIAHWVETCTCIAARLDGGRVEILAPHGVADLVDFVIRPVPTYRTRLPEFHRRVDRKNWRASWPQLTILDA